MNNNINRIINKGIPISTPVEIYTPELLGISKDPEKALKYMQETYKPVVNYINQIMNMDLLRDMTFISIVIKSDPITLEKTLHFSLMNLINQIVNNFGIDITTASHFANTITSFEDLMEVYRTQMLEKIKSLKLITSEDKLKKKFPKLFETYSDSKAGIIILSKWLKETKEKLGNPKTPPTEKLRLLSSVNKYLREELHYNKSIEELYTETSKFSVGYFCQEQALFYENVIKLMPQISEYLSEYKIDISGIGIDEEKLELYIATRFLTAAETAIKPEEKQRYIYYLVAYFNENSYRKEDISTQILVYDLTNPNALENKPQTMVNPHSIYERFRNLMIKNPELKAIDLSKYDFSQMDLKEVEEFIVEYLKDMKTNWELIPPGHDLGIFGITDVDLPIIPPDHPRKPNNSKPSELEELFMRKKRLYGSTDPTYRMKGINTFDGYIAFLYPNGKVILDKFYKNFKTGTLTNEDAIYYMDMSDFFRLSHFSKQELMEDPNAHRIVHQGNWEQKVLEVINAPGNPNSIKYTQELIKTGEISAETRRNIGNKQ